MTASVTLLTPARRPVTPAARSLLPLESLAPRSVGQLAPQPDLTRQCAFDLRSRLGILSIRSDGAARIYNAIRAEKVLA